MTTAEEFAAAQALEYGRFVAAVPIDIGGARAFNPGDPVPMSHVKNNIVSQDQVTVVDDDQLADKLAAAGPGDRFDATPAAADATPVSPDFTPPAEDDPPADDDLTPPDVPAGDDLDEVS